MRACFASLAMMALAACQTDVSGGQAVLVAPPSDDVVPVAFAAGPGRRAVTQQLGTNVVKSACVDTRPRFTRTPETLARLGGFVQDAQTLTYFHQTYDLSVKLIDGRCSVVMGGLKSTDAAIALRDQTGPDGVVSLSQPRRIDGRLYVRFLTKGG
ncbi:hypothetical protein [Tateyamaria sp.]|uniref:hypothetical protein n=1 Tax=Tateyamaria sp. TaxID=1929288 RepID=UPI00329B6598